MGAQPEWIGEHPPEYNEPEDMTECTDCEKTLPVNNFFVVEEYINNGYIKVPFCGQCLTNRVSEMLEFGRYEVTHEETENELTIKIKRK
jgi:hypothetical protein